MKDKVVLAQCTIVLVIAIVFLGVLLPHGYARGRGGAPHGGGASRGGGFSREGPAANGGLSSRPGSTQAGQRSAQVSRQQYAASAQASRQQHATNAQASRQEYAEHGYPYNNWDAGRGLAVATGAAIGASAANAVASTATAPMYSSGQPCADSTVVSVGDTQYFGCGSLWYTQAYGPSGPTFVQIAAPPGY